MEKITLQDRNMFFKTDTIEYRIRGFEDIILSHLRVNIKVTFKDDFFIDIVDLYSQKSRMGFLNKVCKQLDVSREAVKNDLYKIIDAIEKHQSEKNAPPRKNEIKLSIEEESQSVKALRDPNLLKRLASDIETLGYIGEEKNKVIGYLVSISRKLDDPLSAIIISDSSAGKSALSDVIERLTPPEEIVYLSSITAKALYYMDKDHLKHKFVIIEEREGSLASDYPIRILQSKKRLIQAVPIKDPNTNKTRSITIEVEGPISYLETTTRTRINYENSTRCFELYLDTSASQTSRIHQMQKESKTGIGLERRTKAAEVIKRHHNMQRLLKKVNIINPFAFYINFPSKSLRTRRDHLRFLNLIEVVTFLHQYQRPAKTINGIPHIESTTRDYKIAYDLYCELLQHTLSDLNKPQRDFLNSIKVLVKEKGVDCFSRKDLREYTGFPHHKVRDMTHDLAELEYIFPETVSQGKRTIYRLNAGTGEGAFILKELTKPEELVEYMTSTS